jgi:hypothetical protein
MLLVRVLSDSVCESFQPSDSGQNHRQPLQKIGHQVYLIFVFCRDAINLTVCFSIRRPRIFRNFAIWEHCTLDDYIFGRGNLNTFRVNSRSQYSVWRIFSPHICIEITCKMFVLFLGNWSNTLSTSPEWLSLVPSRLSSVEVCTFRTITTNDLRILHTTTYYQ